MRLFHVSENPTITMQPKGLYGPSMRDACQII